MSRHHVQNMQHVYGAWYDPLTTAMSYTPAGWLAKKAAQEAGKVYYGPLADEQKGTVSAYCVDQIGILGKRGARVYCAALRDAMGGKPPGTTKRYRRVDPQPSDPDYKPPPEKKDNTLLYAVIGLTVVVGGGIILATRRGRS